LSDPAMEDALYEIESMRRFAGLELNEDAIPDETTILKFRRFLEQHGLAVKILEAVNAHPGPAGSAAAPGHDRGRHDHPGAVVDQEPRQAA
jgi:transposase, IS5 family